MTEVVISAAQNLLNLNSNRDGGSKIFKDGRDKLRNLLLELPVELSAQRKHADNLLTAMDGRFVAKTVGTWRPFVVCIVRALGAGKAQLAEACKKAKVGLDSNALRAAEHDAEMINEGMPIFLDKKRPVSLATPRGKRQGKAEMLSLDTPLKRMKMNAEPCDTNEDKNDFDGQPPETLANSVLQCQNDVKQAVATCKPHRLCEQSNIKAKSGLERFMVSKKVSKEDLTEDSELQYEQPSQMQRLPPSQRSTSPLLESKSQRPASPLLESKSNKNRHRICSRMGCRNMRSRDKGKNKTGAKPIANDPKGYYARLCLGTDASVNDIRSAYKKCALICHPDKGGNPQAFRAIAEAYEVLSNPDKRAVYDGRKRITLSSTTTPATSKSASDNVQRAKDVYANMLLTPKENWSRLLGSVDIDVIKVLENELNQFVAEQADNNTEKQTGTTDYVSKGIKQNIDKTWWVQIGWRGFKVSADRIESMERAVHLHDALTQIRNSAMARYKQEVSDLADLGIKVRKMGADSLDTIPLLTRNELLELYQEEPFIPLHFSSDLHNPTLKRNGQEKDLQKQQGVRKKQALQDHRIQTNWTPSYEAAMDFRRLVRNTQAHGGKFDELRITMSTRAKEHRNDRIHLTRHAALLVKEILEKLKLEGRLACVDDVKDRPLALKDNTEEMLLDMSNRIKSMEESHKKTEVALRVQVEDLEDRRRKEAIEFEARHRKEQEKHHDEQIRELQEKLSEAQRAKEISEEVCNRMQEAFLYKPQPLLSRSPFSNQLQRGCTSVQEDRKSNMVMQAVNSADRSLRYRVPSPTVLEPRGSYSLMGR